MRLSHEYSYTSTENETPNTMASPPTSQKLQASRWGFFQQAVASVESRLDNILGEEDDVPKKPQPAPPRLARTNSQPQRLSTEISRSGASTPANDRLQERLARAMAKKGGSRPESPMPAGNGASLPNTPNLAPTALLAQEESTSMSGQAGGLAEEASLRDSLDSARVIVTEAPDESPLPGEDVDQSQKVPTSTNLQPQPAEATLSDFGSARTSIEGLSDSQTAMSNRVSLDSQAKDGASISLQVENDESQRRMQEEITGYMERIDSLQAKLLYLTKEAADSAKQAAAAAQSGSVEKKLLEKDEKIALLMEEGQKLSKAEMKHLTTLKKMRAQSTSTSKEQDAAKARAEKAERSLRIMEDRAKRAEAATKRAEQNLATSLDATTGFEAVRKERDALNATLADIKAQLSRANERAEAAEGRADSEQLEKERKRNADLHDDLTSVKVERELSEEKLRREIKDLKASVEREKEHAKAMETEMLGEQAALESKLESFRARAEEASSSDHGDVQAKLLRQIETLQSQYAAASQNWQGIEGSLLGRITNLEKERDDIANRESDIRRKLREITLKAKRTERELEEAQNRLPDLEKNQIETEEELQRSARKIKQLEADLVKSSKDLEDQKIQAERDSLRRLEEEKAKWTAASLNVPRTDSPGTSMRKGSSLGLDFAHPLHTGGSRRPSILPPHDSNTPPRQYSLASIKGFSNGAVVPETPSLVTSNDDEYFANVPPTPASQNHIPSPRGAAMHDLISTSTVGAGPSVQLVERMSANVRRLESEKSASKDEILRLTTQRDESRREVVDLMREVEEKRKIDERLKALEDEHKDLSERHATTLEMLGEKSERVEELRLDLADVKAMYRSLADTMK